MNNALKVICTKCPANKYLNNDYKCVDCSTAISNCLGCISNPNRLGTICSACNTAGGYYPTEGKLTCALCSQLNCKKCQLTTSGINQCTECSDKKYLTNCKTKCDDCGNVIPGCTDCGTNLLNPSCKTCDNAKKVYAADGICKACSEIIKNCITCV